MNVTNTIRIRATITEPVVNLFQSQHAREPLGARPVDLSQVLGVQHRQFAAGGSHAKMQPGGASDFVVSADASVVTSTEMSPPDDDHRSSGGPPAVRRRRRRSKRVTPRDC